MNPFHQSDKKYYNLDPPSYVLQSTGPSYNRRRSDSTSSGDSTSSSESGVINNIKHRLLAREDPAFMQARQQLLDAEAVEKEAERAHDAAKHRVKEARGALKRLERQAREEAKRIRNHQIQGQQVTSGFLQVRRR